MIMRFNFLRQIEPDRSIRAEGEFSFGKLRFVHALMGPSAAGKTTFARWIAGLEKPGGKLQWGEEFWEDDTHCTSPQARRVGFVAQGDWLFPHLTVKENIAFGLRRWKNEERKNRVEDLMVLTGVKGLAQKFPRHLSGGEKRRVALAQALAPNPRLLLLDEPFTGLDQSAREALGADLKKWIEALELPTILITHDLAEAAAFGACLHRFRNGVLGL